MFPDTELDTDKENKSYWDSTIAPLPAPARDLRTIQQLNISIYKEEETCASINCVIV